MFMTDHGEGRPAGFSVVRETRGERQLHRLVTLPASCLGATGPVSEMRPKDLGRAGELMVCAYLGSVGLEVVERNWSCPSGEVDIVAREDDGTLVFVEVKTRRVRELRWSMPELAVDEAKQRRYLDIASRYLAQGAAPALARFDVAGISVMEGADPLLHYISGAFWCDE